MDWFKEHWATIVTLGCILIVAFVETWQQATVNLSSNSHSLRLQGGWNYLPLILLSVAGIVWLVRGRGQERVKVRAYQAPTQIPGIPTLSALLGQNPNISFDPKQFFARSYFSPLTAEVEQNIKTIAQRSSPQDREAFYARFIGVGVVAYQHDVTWFTIYRSQLEAMAELNSRGMIPVADLKKHYDNAALACPSVYANYSFDQWLYYMESRMLIAKYPSQMVEISFNGKDCLKYLAHHGLNTSNRQC